VAAVTGVTAFAVLYGLVWHGALIPLFGLLVPLAVSALMSDAIGTALVGTSSRRFGVASWLLLLAAFVIRMGLSRSEQRRDLLTALWISSTFVSLYVVAQRLGVDPFGDSGGSVLRPGSMI
jgi:uncharacterized membrane protein YozB (DUF420 family)